MSAPSVNLRSSWPPVREEQRPRPGPDLIRLERLLDQAAAASGPADRWPLAQTLSRALGRLLAKAAEASGDGDTPSLEAMFILTDFAVRSWARLGAEKRHRP